ncbi:vacuolar cation/proton exchanger 1-like protein [Trifolium pratense]|uniref:Vacuolar cation/proton exchanger 1-like protein n=1 Tax=Trifolium pratense TaxID=57577 RepID=A0A2K3LVG5_TRIPR|nr:vacuolar cation/proton exchanger 1-like protein [Trifolium pratense]
MNEDMENNVETQENNSSSSSSMVRKKSDIVMVTNNNVRFQMVRNVMINMKEVMLGTKLVVLFPAVPLAVAADFYSLGRIDVILIW